MPPTFDELRTRAQRARREAKAIRTEWKSRSESTQRDQAFKSALRELDDVIAGLRVWEEVQSA